MQQQPVAPQQSVAPQQQQPMMMQQPQPQPQTVVITQQPVPIEDKFGPSAKSQMIVLSTIQIVMACLCILFGLITLGLWFIDYDGIAVIGYGIWIGAFWLIVGIVGHVAAKAEKDSCKIIATMVMNIICTVLFCFNMLGLNAADLGIVSSSACYYGMFCSHNAVTRTFLALNSLMLIMALMQFVITIWCAVLCCGAVCRCCKGSDGHVVQYSNQATGTAVYPGVPMTTSTVVQYSSSSYPAGVHQQGGYIVQQPPAYYSQPQPFYQAGYQQPPPQPVGYHAPPAYNTSYNPAAEPPK